MEERLRELEQRTKELEVQLLRHVERNVVDTNRLNRSTSVLLEHMSVLAEIVDKEKLNVENVIANITTVLNQQEQTNLDAIKSQNDKWYQEYQEKLRNNQFWWTGLLTVVLTVILLGMFSFLATFLATVTDTNTRTIIDTEIKRIESQFGSKPVISPHKNQR